MAVGLLWASHTRNPQMMPIRAWEPVILGGVALLGVIVALRRMRRRSQRIGIGVAAGWIVVLGLTVHADLAFRADRRAVLTARGADAARYAAIGGALVIGYERPEQIRELVERGFVAGIFVTRRNVAGKRADEIAAEIAEFQRLRRTAGLPPLLVAADQEGGPVSRLSPPLPQQPALSSLLDAGAEEAERKAVAYGAAQGAALARLGVTVNLSPVVDLRPNAAPALLDAHTRIATRAIASDPAVVTRVALAYSRGLLAQNVRPVLKHFPGLGSVRGDTHHFSASLDLPRGELEARDWRPFRDILAQTPALMMVGHASVRDIDPAMPASLSPAVIDGVIRRGWQHHGLLISDDMTMAAVFNRGLCDSARRALNAGIDYLLLAYDWEHVFPLLRCLGEARQAGLPEPRVPTGHR